MCRIGLLQIRCLWVLRRTCSPFWLKMSDVSCHCSNVCCRRCLVFYKPRTTNFLSECSR